MGRREGLKRSGSKDLPRCSFRHKNQNQAGKLISNFPSEFPCNLHRAVAEATAPAGVAIVVEGFFDCLRAVNLRDWKGAAP
jgi:hypothetical protein